MFNLTSSAQFMVGESGILYNGVSAPPTVVAGYSYYLDAANTSSYPGSGTTWTDLAGSGANTSLFGSPTFDGSDGTGSIVFNGSSQYGTFNTNAAFDLSGSSGYALENWVKFTNFSTGMIPFSKGIYGSNYDWGFYIPDASHIYAWSAGTASQLIATLSTPLSAGTWYYICAVGDASENTTIYLNGVSLTSGSCFMSDNDHSSPAGEVGGYGPNVPTSFGLLNGKLGVCRLYQFELTGTQVLNNFNAQKSRYGY